MESIRSVVTSITVEPVLFLFMAGSFMQFSAFQALIYSRVCEERYSEFICDHLALDEYKSERDYVQKQSSYWLLSCNIALAVPSIISGIYLGNWSDIFGRKVPLLLPPLGQILSSLVYLVISEHASVHVGYVVLGNALTGLLGGFSSMVMCCMAYLTSLTSERERTVRVALLEAMTFLGGFVGPFVGAAIQDRAGRTWTFLAPLVASAVIVMYVVVAVREVPPPCRPHTPRTAAGRLIQLFSLRHLWDAIMTALKPRAESRRALILLLLAFAFFIMLDTSGLQDVTYLFLKDPPLSLSDSTTFIYSAVKYGSSSASLLVCMPLLRRFLDPSDTTLSAIGLVSKMLGLVWLGFTVHVGMLFVAPFVMMFSTFCIPPVRSLLSKLVEKNEQGRVFALLMTIESLCSLLGSVVYNGLYPATRQWLHGLVFIIIAGTLLVPAALLAAVRRLLGRPAAQQPGQPHTDLASVVDAEENGGEPQ